MAEGTRSREALGPTIGTFTLPQTRAWPCQLSSTLSRLCPLARPPPTQLPELPVRPRPSPPTWSLPRPQTQHPAARPSRRGHRITAPPLPVGPSPPPRPSALRPSQRAPPPRRSAPPGPAPGEVSRRRGLPREADRAAQLAAVFPPIWHTWPEVRREGGEENCRGSRREGPPAFSGPKRVWFHSHGQDEPVPKGANPLPRFPNLSPRSLASAPISRFSSLLPVSDLHPPPFLPSRSR